MQAIVGLAFAKHVAYSTKYDDNEESVHARILQNRFLSVCSVHGLCSRSSDAMLIKHCSAKYTTDLLAGSEVR